MLKLESGENIETRVKVDIDHVKENMGVYGTMDKSYPTARFISFGDGNVYHFDTDDDEYDEDSIGMSYAWDGDGYHLISKDFKMVIP